MMLSHRTRLWAMLLVIGVAGLIIGFSVNGVRIWIVNYQKLSMGLISSRQLIDLADCPCNLTGQTALLA